MKRSEALKLIFERLDWISPRSSTSQLEADADLILTDLEEAGMLPPKLKLDATSPFERGATIHAWELE